MTETAHQCLAAAACRRGVIVDGKRHGALTEKPDTLCPVCMNTVESAVRQLPRDWQELRAALGERSPTTQSRIRSTPTPAIPISTRKEALMTAIVETAERAAGMVAEALHADQPTARRNTAPIITVKDEHGSVQTVPRDDTPAFIAEESVTPDARQLLAAWFRLIDPNVDKLAAAPVEVFAVWDKFGEDNKQPLKRNPETGEAVSARGREFRELSGIDVALQLVELHHQTRAELGLTRLRHRYPMPCPRCGGRVGRDDGQTIVTCDDRHDCKSSWTEREYQFLAGLITRERLDMEINKYLLGEAYSRLDDVQRRLNMLTEADLMLPGAGLLIFEAMRQAIEGHLPPDGRTVATDRKATEQRQTAEDTWTWQNETPYSPPKPKPRRRLTSADPQLSTMVEIDQDAVINGDPRCRDCNLVHRGVCA